MISVKNIVNKIEKTGLLQANISIYNSDIINFLALHLLQSLICKEKHVSKISDESGFISLFLQQQPHKFQLPDKANDVKYFHTHPLPGKPGSCPNQSHHCFFGKLTSQSLLGNTIVESHTLLRKDSYFQISKFSF